MQRGGCRARCRERVSVLVGEVPYDVGAAVNRSDPGLAASTATCQCQSAREQNAKGQGRGRERARNARFQLTTDPSGRGTTATGRPDKETTKKPWGAAHRSENRRPREQCVPAPPRAPSAPHAVPKTPPTLSQRHIVSAVRAASENAAQPAETDAHARPCTPGASSGARGAAYVQKLAPPGEPPKVPSGLRP